MSWKNCLSWGANTNQGSIRVFLWFQWFRQNKNTLRWENDFEIQKKIDILLKSNKNVNRHKF